jgi:hypothetical protein
MTNSPKKSPSKKEYSKPRLKQRIDSAMEAFLDSGGTVQRWVPDVSHHQAQEPSTEQG